MVYFDFNFVMVFFVFFFWGGICLLCVGVGVVVFCFACFAVSWEYMRNGEMDGRYS